MFLSRSGPVFHPQLFIKHSRYTTRGGGKEGCELLRGLEAPTHTTERCTGCMIQISATEKRKEGRLLVVHGTHLRACHTASLPLCSVCCFSKRSERLSLPPLLLCRLRHVHVPRSYALLTVLQEAEDVRDVKRADEDAAAAGDSTNEDAEPASRAIANTTRFMEKFILLLCRLWYMYAYCTRAHQPADKGVPSMHPRHTYLDAHSTIPPDPEDIRCHAFRVRSLSLLQQIPGVGGTRFGTRKDCRRGAEQRRSFPIPRGACVVRK